MFIFTDWRHTTYKSTERQHLVGTPSRGRLLPVRRLWRTGSGCCPVFHNFPFGYKLRLLRYFLRCSYLRTRSRFSETTPISGPAIAESVLWGWVWNLGTSRSVARSLGVAYSPVPILRRVRSPECCIISPSNVSIFVNYKVNLTAVHTVTLVAQ